MLVKYDNAILLKNKLKTKKKRVYVLKHTIPILDSIDFKLYLNRLTCSLYLSLKRNKT